MRDRRFCGRRVRVAEFCGAFALRAVVLGGVTSIDGVTWTRGVRQFGR